MEQQTIEPNTKKSVISLPAAILSGAVIIAIALIIALGPKGSPKTPPAADTGTGDITSIPAQAAKISDDDYVRGNAATAEVVVIEYADSDCIWCQRFHPTILSLVKDYAGKVATVYRHYPVVSLHPNATNEAVALECVGELGGADEFNTYLDTIINVTLTADAKSNETLVTFAKTQGINEKLFRECIANPATTKKVEDSLAYAEQIGIRGTPFSAIVNVKTGEQIIVPGAASLETMKAHIDSLLK